VGKLSAISRQLSAKIKVMSDEYEKSVFYSSLITFDSLLFSQHYKADR
jgi:hypothetical protein